MAKKLTLNYIIDELHKEGYKVLSDHYVNAHVPLILECPNSHKIKLSWQKWKIGRRCMYCNGSTLCFEDVKDSFEAEGYKLLSTEVNSKKKLHFICNKGHEGSIFWSNWKCGTRCNKCYLSNLKYKFNLIVGEVHSDGYSVHSDEHYYIKTGKLIVTCNNGHDSYETGVNKWHSGSRCKQCGYNKLSNLHKKNYSDIKNFITNCGYTLLSTKYLNAFDKLDVKCSKGHEYSVRWNDFQQGCRCPKCSTVVSNGQQEIQEFLNLLGFNFEENNRSIIKPYELDIVIPSKEIAIEYCGLYWHSELCGKDKDYHMNKLKKCEEVGYRLITIFEDEWMYKKNIVKNRLRSILNKTNNKDICVEECVVKEIDNDTKNNFLDSNHIQGSSASSVSLGCFYKNKLVSVMTFSNFKNKRVWCVDRVCSLACYNLKKAEVELMNYFKKKYNWQKIFGYSDLRWFTGDLFKVLNFKLSGITNPKCWYIKNGVRRMPVDLDKCYKLWDCGDLKFILNKKMDMIKGDFTNE